MAQLKDTVVSGSLRATDSLLTTTLQTQILNIPTTSGGATYGPGTDGYIVSTNGTSIYWRGVKNNTTIGDLGWSSTTNDFVLITSNTLAYWNGRYNSSTSNLAYCNKGAFGTIVTYTAASANTASTAVIRDASGNFSAGTITASLNGTASAANRLVSRGNVTCETGGNKPAVAGLSMSQVYNNGYPTTYGNVMTMYGSGAGQLLLGWSGSSSTTTGVHADVYVRSQRDTASTLWSDWYVVIDSANWYKQIFANRNIARTTLTVTSSSWGVTSGTDVFGLAFKDTGLTYTPSGGSATASSDTGDWRAWLTCAAASNTVELNMRIDGSWQAGKFIGPLQGNADTATRVICPDASISYISGAAGNNAAVYAKKNTGSRWYPAVTLQTAGGGAWQIGNYNDETLEFQYATAANISSQNNTTSEIYMQNGDTGRVITTGNYSSWIVPKTGGTFSGNVFIVTDSGDHYFEVKSNATGVRLELDNSGSTNHGLWSSGYWSGSAYTASSSWMIYRNASGTTVVNGNCTGSSGSCTGTAANSNILNKSTLGWSNTTAGLRWTRTENGSSATNYDCIITMQDGNRGAALFIDWRSTQYNLYYRTKHDDTGNNNWRAATRIWVAGNAVTNAVWNDLAECRKSNLREPGYAITPSGLRTTKRLEPGCRITSDTWGFALGDENDETKMPVAISGRVLAYPARPREEYHLGDCVCSAPDGKVDIMTRQEIRDWPDCIIGIVNEIPNYEEWGSDIKDNVGRTKVKVNGRIWIDIK